MAKKKDQEIKVSDIQMKEIEAPRVIVISGAEACKIKGVNELLTKYVEKKYPNTLMLLKDWEVTLTKDRVI